MARQNVGNPKFYVDLLSYWWARGNVKGVGFKKNAMDTPDLHMRGAEGYRPSLIGLNPTEYLDEEFYYENKVIFRIELKDGIYLPQGVADKFFFGFLGHNFKSAVYSNPSIQFFDFYGDNLLELTSSDIDEICNTDFSYNGWSLSEWTGGSAVDNCYVVDFIIDKGGYGDIRSLLGSLAFGNVFQMPHSPDLNLTMTREYKGTKEQETIGGSTLTQIDYFKSPDWAGYPAWELFTGNPLSYIDNNFKETRTPARGRRVWDLKFSYISSDDLFAINELVNGSNPTDSWTNSDAGYDSGDFNSTGGFTTDIRRSSSFLAVIMNNTIGGALPFIFQPDGNNNSPDQFAIAKIDQSSFKYQQVANNVYNISLKIREVW